MVSSEVKTLSKSLYPPGASLEGLCGIIIPAYNEAATVTTVVEVALASNLGPVLVVDDGSSDATAERALAAGAAVLSLKPNQGKGGAVYAAAETLQTTCVVLLDADLTGLTAEHIHKLAQPVISGEVMMTRGTFSGGRFQTSLAQHLMPMLNGQRSLLRKLLLQLPELRSSRYGIEVVITQAAREQNWLWRDVDLAGVSQVMKEEKRGFWKGLKIRLGMYRDIVKRLLRI